MWYSGFQTSSSSAPRMAPSPQDKGRRGSKIGEEEFVLYLQGIPAHCRWQELKDFVRQTALHIRQAVVYDDQYGYPTGIGQIIVKNEDEAWRTFRKLSSNGWNGQALTVTLARASSPTKPIAGPTRSSSAPSFGSNFSRSTVTGTPASTSSVAPDSMATSSTKSYPPSAPVPLMNYGPMGQNSQIVPTTVSTGYLPGSWTANPEAHPFSPTSAAMFSPTFNQMEYSYYPNPMPVTQQPMYSPPMFIHTAPYYQPGYHAPCTYEPLKSTMYPTTGGYASIPRTFQPPPICSVIIENIRLGVDVQTLKSHFRGVGIVQHCEILSYDSSRGQQQQQQHNTGYYARATFQSADEAERAVALCNGTVLSGNQITVRLDLDSGSSSVVPPLLPPALADLEDWSSSSTTTPPSFFHPNHYHQHPPQPAAAPAAAPSSVPSEEWNMFLHSTSTPSTSSSSTIVPSSSSHRSSASGIHLQESAAARHRRDSGKELMQNKTQDEEKKENETKTTTTTTTNTESKISTPFHPHPSSSSSSSSSSSTLSVDCASVKQQLLVVNGSMTGRAKM